MKAWNIYFYFELEEMLAAQSKWSFYLYIPVKFISKLAAIIVSHSHLQQVISKQAVIMVSYFHLLLFLVRMILLSLL